MQESHILPSPLYCHAWNPNRNGNNENIKSLKEIAVAVANEILVFKKTGSGFVLACTLSEHQDHVTSLSWSLKNRIVSCSSDRNAYVWTLEAAAWKPTLVLLRIPKGARCVAWNSAENKFVVGSVGLVAVCWFDEENNWWVSKHIKVKGTVLSIEWHSGGILFACGSTDGRAVSHSRIYLILKKVISGFVKGIDKKAGDAVWGDKLPIGTICGDFNAESWVHAVAFSPSGNTVAWAAHNSTLSVASPSENYQCTVKTPFLPILSLLFLSETHLVGVGHDAIPFLFTSRNGDWTFTQKLEVSTIKEVANTAMNKFKLMDTKGQTESDESVNLNSVTTILAVAVSGANVTKFSTSGLDGRIVIWDVLSMGIANLRI